MLGDRVISKLALVLASSAKLKKKSSAQKTAGQRVSPRETVVAWESLSTSEGTWSTREESQQELV